MGRALESDHSGFEFHLATFWPDLSLSFLICKMGGQREGPLGAGPGSISESVVGISREQGAWAKRAVSPCPQGPPRGSWAKPEVKDFPASLRESPPWGCALRSGLRKYQPRHSLLAMLRGGEQTLCPPSTPKVKMTPKWAAGPPAFGSGAWVSVPGTPCPRLATPGPRWRPFHS